MKKGFFLLTITFFWILLASCAVHHSGGVCGGPLLHHGDRIVAIATGKALDRFVLGFGNIKNEDLVQKAKADLYLNHTLKNDEYFSNFSTSITDKYFFGIIHTTKVSVSAEVLSSIDSLSSKYSPEFQEQLSRELQSVRSRPRGGLAQSKFMTMKEGDSVYYSANSRDFHLYVVSNKNSESAVLIATEPMQRNKLVSSQENIFGKDTGKTGLNSGEAVAVEVVDAFNKMKTEPATVLGVSSDLFLVKTVSGFHVLPRNKIRKLNQ